MAGLALAGILGAAVWATPAHATTRAAVDAANPGPADDTNSAAANTAPANPTPAASTPADDTAGTTPPTSPPATPGPPTIDPLPTGLVTVFPLTVSGTGDPGDLMHVSAGAGSTAGAHCDAPVDAQGAWTCALATPPNGPGVAVRGVSRDSGLSTSGRVDVLSPPVIAAQNGALVSGGGVHGTAYPGATVTVRAENGSTCSFPADSTGTWGCVLSKPLASGKHTITATQRAPFSSQSSARSASVAITVDTTAPAAPRIGSPASGTRSTPGRTLTFSGTGENAAKVTVYGSDARGSTVLCTAAVRGTAWSCAGTLAAGSFTVSALQRDAAGNVSGGSNPVAITVQAAAPAPSPTQPGSPAAAPTPSPTTPAPAVPAVPPGTTPSPTPSDPYTGQREPGMPDWMGTPFTSASAPVVSVASFPGWLRSLLLAAAALLLLALPARLLAVTVARDRDDQPRRDRASIFGRNRSRAELRDADGLSFAGGAGAVDAPGGSGAAGLLGGLGAARASAGAGASRAAGGSGPGASRAAGASGPGASRAEGAAESAGATRSPLLLAAAFAAAAALVTLSSPVDDAAAYLRVLLALAVALAAVNAVWVAVARWTSPHFGGGRATLVFRPSMLVIVGVTAIASRLLGLQPALLFGLILGVAFAGAAGRVARGRVAGVQVASAAVLGVLAWLAVGALPEPTGVVSAFFRELANAISLLGLGSAAIALLPIGGLAGRAVFQWSRGIWLGLGLVVYTLLFALLLPVASLVETGQGALVIGLAAVGFAVLSVCVWLWERFVEPSR